MARVTVEWALPPEDWMMPAAIVFHHAIQESSASYQGDHEDQLVVHVALFRESERPAECQGAELPPVQDTKVELLAHPMVHVVQRSPVLQTALGKAVIKRNLIVLALSLILGFIFVSFWLEPFSTSYKVPGNEAAFLVRSPDAMLITSVATFGFLFLIGHIASRHLVKMCFRNSFSLLILLYIIVAQSIVLYESFAVLHSVGKLTRWFMFSQVIHSMCRVGLFSVLGVMDALLIGVRAKTFLCLCAIPSIVFAYLRRPRGEHVEPLCLWQWCIDLQAAHAWAITNELTFAMRLLLCYLAGYNYTSLQPAYFDVHRKELGFQIARSVSFLSRRWTRCEVHQPCTFAQSSDFKHMCNEMRRMSAPNDPDLGGAPWQDLRKDCVTPSAECCAGIPRLHGDEEEHSREAAALDQHMRPDSEDEDCEAEDSLPFRIIPHAFRIIRHANRIGTNLHL